jgi:hypothetical protein
MKLPTAHTHLNGLAAGLPFNPTHVPARPVRLSTAAETAAVVLFHTFGCGFCRKAFAGGV